MWVMSYDKKQLIDAERFSVQKNIGGGQDKKWAISAGKRTLEYIFGYYPDEESAKAELKRICDAIGEGKPCYTSAK